VRLRRTLLEKTWAKKGPLAPPARAVNRRPPAAGRLRQPQPHCDRERAATARRPHRHRYRPPTAAVQRSSPL